MQIELFRTLEILIKDNNCDSYAYSDVSETDLIKELTSNREGIILEGFYYTGN